MVTLFLLFYVAVLLNASVVFVGLCFGLFVVSLEFVVHLFVGIAVSVFRWLCCLYCRIICRLLQWLRIPLALLSSLTAYSLASSMVTSLASMLLTLFVGIIVGLFRLSLYWRFFREL